MPEHDLATLITFNIFLTMTGILGAFIGAWAIIRQNIRATHEMTEGMGHIAQEVRQVADIQREVAFMIRRQYGDIDQDLQEIKDLLGGSR